jgi:hypothetical protein
LQITLLQYLPYTGYGPGLIFCQLLPGREYKGSSHKPPDYDSKLVQPDGTGGLLQGCGSGLIQSGSWIWIRHFSSIRIHKGKYVDKFFLEVLKINIKIKNTCSLYYFLPFSYKYV